MIPKKRRRAAPSPDGSTTIASAGGTRQPSSADLRRDTEAALGALEQEVVLQPVALGQQ